MAKPHKKHSLSHRDYTIISMRWLLTKSSIDLAAWEIAVSKRSIVDAIGMNTNLTVQNKTIAIIEVKRTKADLLGDLARGKMLKYMGFASHCYLAATGEALAYIGNNSKAATFALLAEYGLPDTWGVLLLPKSSGSKITVLREAKRLSNPSAEKANRLLRHIAKSYMWKTINNVFEKDKPILTATKGETDVLYEPE